MDCTLTTVEQRVERLKEALGREAMFDIGEWCSSEPKAFKSAVTAHDTPRTSCNSVMCIGGMIEHLAETEWGLEIQYDTFGRAFRSFNFSLGDCIGITNPDVAEDLFYPPMLLEYSKITIEMAHDAIDNAVCYGDPLWMEVCRYHCRPEQRKDMLNWAYISLEHSEGRLAAEKFLES